MPRIFESALGQVMFHEQRGFIRPKNVIRNDETHTVDRINTDYS